jgi:hypothetical protein
MLLPAWATMCSDAEFSTVCDRSREQPASTCKALARGVPVCAVPFGRDHLEFARRVEVAEAGTGLPARRLRPDRLRAKTRQAITRAAGARRVAAGFAAAGGAAAAATAVEDRLLGFHQVQAARAGGRMPVILAAT